MPSPSVKSLDDVKQDLPVDTGIAREVQILRQSEWKDDLLRTGIRGKGGQDFEHEEMRVLIST